MMKRSMKTMISLLLLAMILCFGSVNAMAATVEEEEAPLASFHWVSDTHIEVAPDVYKQALQGMAGINADTNIGLIVTGDITDYCKDTSYTQFYGLTEHYSPVSAANTAIIMGNHDVRSASKSGWYGTPSGYNSETSNWEIAKNFYLSYNADYMPSADQVYHVKELGGYTFIMLNPEMDLKDAMYMSETQLAWLEQTLAAAYAKDPQKPVFIVSHQALMDTHAGSNAYNQTIYVGEKTPEESNAAIKEILAKYPTSIFLSGHMHHAFATSVGVVRPYGSFVEAPALRDGGNGYEVQIYADRVVFRAVNYATGEYFPNEDITISVGDSNVSRVYQEAQKVLADADSYDETEIANIRALSDTLGGLITVSYDTVDSLENFYTATQHAEINAAAQNLRTALEDLSISIPAEGADVTLSAGETLQLTVSGAVSWTSNDRSIVTIDENGKLTALKKGETTVTVTTADGSVTCNVTVTVDTSAISNAIGVADTLKANVVTAEMACGAGEGNLYVTAAEMQALNDALAAAVTAKTDAATAAEVESAAAALDTALNTFRSVIKPGVAHEGESATATTCKYGCGTAIAAVASVTVDGVTTNYTSFEAAIAAAPAGGTVVLLSDITVDATITIDKALTVDGNGKLINTSVQLFYVTASGDNNTVVEFKNLDVISTGTGDGGRVIWQDASKKVNIKITNCHFFSNGDVIYMKKPQAGYTMTIESSTLVSGAELLQINESPSKDHTVNIINSKLYAASYIVYYYRGTGGQFNITSSDISFASGITNIIKRNRTPAYKFVLNDGTVIGAAFNVTRPDGKVISCPASTNVAFNLNSAETLTLSGNVTFNSGAGNAAFTSAGTVDLTAFTGAEIVRKNGNNYYFYGKDTTLSDVIEAAEAGDTVILNKDLTLDTAITINKTLTIDGQGIYYIRSSADTAFYVNGAITVKLSDLRFTADKVAFTYDNNAETNTAVTLSKVGFLAGTPTAGMNESGDSFTNASVVVAQVGGVGYLELSDAIAAASAGDIVTLLANVTVDATITIDKTLTIDGDGYLLTNTADSFVFSVTASGVTFTVQDIKMVSEATGDNSIIYVYQKSVDLFVSNATLYSTGDVLRFNMKNTTDATTTIENSTLVSVSTQTIQINEAPASYELIITDSKLYSVSSNVLYYWKCTGATVIEDSELSSGTNTAINTAKKQAHFTFNDGTKLGGTFCVEKPGSTTGEKAEGVERSAGNFATPNTFTFNGNVQFLCSGDYLANGSKVTFGATFNSTQIIRLSGTTYYFYDNVDAAFAAKQDGDTVFSYAESSVQNKGYVTETATDENGTTYYKVGQIDTSLIDSAIADANNKKSGIAQADKPCAAGIGNQYVSVAQMQALNDAITEAEEKKTSATTGGEVLDAVQKLIDALETFENAVEIGEAHKDEGKDHTCDYGCGERMGGACSDSDTDTDHVCDYCGVTKLNDCKPNADDGNCTTAITCSVCGTVMTPAKAAHTGGTATCAVKAECTVCGTEYGDFAKHNDSDTDDDHVCDYGCGEKLNDCTGGTATCKELAKCTVCGAEYGELGAHDMVTDAAKAPTCTETGLSEGAHCSRCDTVTTAQETVAATGHKYDSDTDASCNVCGAERTVENANGGENNTNGNENTANGSENNAQNGNTEAPAKKGLSGGAIAGIVIGAVALLGGGFALFWFVVRKKRL